ncbi:MAG: cellulose biosynthesis protein BcsE [Burkholderiales bacterium]
MQTTVKNQWQLRIDGLEAGISLRGGNLYAIFEEDGRLASSLIWGTLIDACNQGGSACFISMSNVAKAMEESGLAQDARTAIIDKKLAVLEMHPSFEHFHGKARVARVIDEMRYWGAAGKRLLVIDGAKRLFRQIDADLLRTWRDWAESQCIAVVLVVRQDPIDNGAIAGLLPDSHYLAGLARLKSRYGVGSWEIFHWFEGSGVVAGKTFPIRRNDSARLEVQTTETMAADAVAAAAPAADEAQVWAMRSAFLPQEIVNASWQIIDRMDDLPANASGSVAATMVIAFTQKTDFRQLARCVFDLRKRCGGRLKIVIREMDSRLRYSQETLAVRLGANLVACAEISYSRLLNLIMMLQGQVFPFSLPDTYEQALAEAHPDQEQGYLTPTEFCRAASATLEHSHILGVQNVLLRLPLAYGLLPLDALRYCNIKRPGDLCSSDEKSVYLFLFACREADVDAALDRLFGLPVSDLFSEVALFLSEYGIREALTDLDLRNSDAPFPDLTAALANDATVKPEPAAAKATPKPSGPVEIRHSAPKPAVHCPLAT